MTYTNPTYSHSNEIIAAIATDRYLEVERTLGNVSPDTQFIGTGVRRIAAAFIAMHRGQVAEAMQDLIRMRRGGIRTTIEASLARYVLGRCHILLGELDAAQENLEIALGQCHDAKLQHLIEHWMAELKNLRNAGTGTTIDLSQRAFVPPATAIAQALDFDLQSISVTLADERTISAPLKWFPLLLALNTREREEYQIVDDGRTVVWPNFGFRVRVADLLAGGDG